MDDGRTEEEGAVARVPARDELREAARRLMASATLDDLTAFVTVRRLTEGTGLSSGAVYSAFQPEPGVDGRSRSAPQAAAREAFLDLGGEGDELAEVINDLVTAAISGAGSDVQGLIEWLANVLADPMIASARAIDDEHGWHFTHLMLAGAVSPNDAEISRAYAEELNSYDRLLQAPSAAMLEYTGRELIDGIDLASFTRMFNLALEGFAFRTRLDPDLDPSVLPTMYQGIWMAFTRPVDARDDRRGHRLALPGRHPLTDEEMAAVRAATMRVTERAGWAAVTLAKVGQLARVADAHLAGHFATRHELATIVWERVVDDLERRDRGRAGLAPAESLGALVDDIVDAACSQRSLVASLLISRLQSTSLSEEDSQDPATVRAAALLEAALSAASTGTPPPSAEAAAAVGALHRRMSRTTLDLILSRAAMSEDSVETLTALTLDGISGFDIAVPDRGPVEQ